jgi:alcohol dehydrogenase class IV
MLSFVYDILPSRVIFGVGCAEKLPKEIERLGASRALVLSTPQQRDPLPIPGVPTSWGSEMTPIWGLTQDGRKSTGRDARVLPKTVLYDPALTVSMPAGLSATSGINAIAHCVEALYAKDGNHHRFDDR